MDDIYTFAKAIRSRGDFTEFLRHLIIDLESNREGWENATLEEYLEAFSGWVDDMDGYYLNVGKPTPKELDWNLLGKMFLAARTYE